MRRFVLVTTCGAALLCARCAPDNASEVRELKPESVGLLGFIHHPDGEKAYGITGDYSKNSSVENSGLYTIIDPERSAKITNQWQVSLFYHHYPWKTSAFFAGIGFDYMAHDLQWQEQTNAYTAANPTRTQVQYGDRALYFRIPLGWAWIWNSGFTLMFDFGPGFRLYRGTRWINDGTAGNVDTGSRDDFANHVGDQVFKFGGSGLIGWSF